MPLTQEECAAAVAEHSRGFAEAAAGNFDAAVEFCPGWTVRDVVHHLTGVQWFWATLVEQGWTERPDDLEDPRRRVTRRLWTSSAPEPSGWSGCWLRPTRRPAVWTWAPTKQDAGFVIRHQVQEAVGHHWDVAHAAGRIRDRSRRRSARTRSTSSSTFSVSKPTTPTRPTRSRNRSTDGSGWPAPTAMRRGW